MQDAKFLSDIELACRYCVSRSTIWRWTNEGRLPKPRRIGPNTSRWLREEIERREAELLGSGEAA